MRFFRPVPWQNTDSVSDNFLITTKLLTVSIFRDKHKLSFQLEGLQRFILASARFTTWHGHGVAWTWTGKAWLWLGMARIMVGHGMDAARRGMGCSPIQLKGRAPMETHRGFTVFRAIPKPNSVSDLWFSTNQHLCRNHQIGPEACACRRVSPDCLRGQRARPRCTAQPLQSQPYSMSVT